MPIARRRGRPWPTDERNSVSDPIMDAQAALMSARSAIDRSLEDLRHVQQGLFADRPEAA